MFSQVPSGGGGGGGVTVAAGGGGGGGGADKPEEKEKEKEEEKVCCSIHGLDFAIYSLFVIRRNRMRTWASDCSINPRGRSVNYDEKGLLTATYLIPPRFARTLMLRTMLCCVTLNMNETRMPRFGLDRPLARMGMDS